MMWFNLKVNKCPSCNKDLATTATYTPEMIECNCGFKIRQSRYKEIVTGMLNKDLEEHYNTKGSIFFCDGCNAMVKGEGYLIKRKTYCLNHYKEHFPKFKPEEENV